MRKPNQLSLFGGGSGRGLLFGSGILAQYLNEQRTLPIDEIDRKAEAVRRWTSSLASSTAGELSLEQQFLQQVFGDVLGYRIYPAGGGDIATLYPKPASRLTHISRSPDAALGEFTDDDARFFGIIELKSPGTDLDAPQARHESETPVEQAFYYAERILGVRWVVVSDMQVIRLYSVEASGEYEVVDLRDCVSEDGRATDQFRKLHFLFHRTCLVEGQSQSPVSRLLAKSTANQIEIREGFYVAYYEIRVDLFDAIRDATKDRLPLPGREELLEATQRLLDRLLFIYYCEDHPAQLIENNTVRRVAEASRQMPGASATKVYDALKQLFREVDEGSPPASSLRVAGYNGELFKCHPIIDSISLPDSLHDRLYRATEPSGAFRAIQGVWGLHVYDFWTELNEHLLGHIFEESLSDLIEIGGGGTASPAEKLKERKAGGIYYTTQVLSDFLSASALGAILDEHSPLDRTTPLSLEQSIKRRLDTLLKLHVLDPACGSGAFLVSVFREMLDEYWRLHLTQDSLARLKRGYRDDLFAGQTRIDQASLLRECLYGVDMLPQAVEIAKLALWLRSARKGEKVPDLGGNILSADSLRVEALFEHLRFRPGQFDLVIGNPPWGGEVADDVYAEALAALGMPAGDRWDSWELFVVLGLRALREGGRLALVLPDSFLYPKKSRLREILLRETTIEKVHSLGPDWFGKHVRMGTVLLQARRGKPNPAANIQCFVAAGELRERAIKGELPLTQIESQRSKVFPMARPMASATFEIEVSRGSRDDALMDLMVRQSTPLGGLCSRARGEEMSKSGLYWECPSCLVPTTPGTKTKGGGFESKRCRGCGALLEEPSVRKASLVSDSRATFKQVPFIDGDDVSRRYLSVTPQKWLRLELPGWNYKAAELYAAPKILVRQAGVGIVATLDESEARCPQSIYIYRLTPAAKKDGYRLEYLLAALLSRTMAYYVFRRFSEVDPAKAHAKLTHERLSELPIPRIDWDVPQERRAHNEVVRLVALLLRKEAPLGGAEDREIEQLLRSQWGITPEDGAYVNGEFFDLPDSQVKRDLFPDGPPRPVAD